MARTAGTRKSQFSEPSNTPFLSDKLNQPRLLLEGFSASLNPTDQGAPVMRSTTILAVVMFLSVLAWPQNWPTSITPNTVTPLDETGVIAYGPYNGARENIGLTNGNLNIQIPLLVLPQRAGRSFDLNLVYDSKRLSLQSLFLPNPGIYELQWSATFFGQSGQLGQWVIGIPQISAAVSLAGFAEVSTEPPSYTPYNCVNQWVLTLADGSKHGFYNQQDCDPNAPGNVQIRTLSDVNDSSYIRLDATNRSDIVAYLKDGTELHFYGYVPGYNYVAAFDRMIDPNGNVITTTKSNGAVVAINDSVGRVISISNGAPGNGTISYSDANGSPRQISFGSAKSGTGADIALVHPDYNGLQGDCWDGNGHVVDAVGTDFGTATYHGSITIPTGSSTSIVFQYDEDAAGELTKIYYPTGGYARYDYQVFPAAYGQTNEFGCTDVDFRQLIAKHECTSSSGCTTGQEFTTTYAPVIGLTAANSTNTVTNPDGTSVVHQFSQATGLASPRETDTTFKDTNGKTVRTVHTDYTITSVCGTTGTNSELDESFLPCRVTTTQYDPTATVQYKTETDYNKNNTLTNPPPNTIDNAGALIDNAKEVRHYDFDGTLKRKVDDTWLSAYGNNGRIMSLKLNEIVYDGSGNFAAETDNEYDNYGSNGLSSSGAVNHNTVGTLRGNVTGVTRYVSASGTLPKMVRTYDDAGNVTSVTDTNKNQTQYSYADNFAQTTCAPSTGQAAAYVTKITNAAKQATTFSFNSCFGDVAWTKDLNGQQTSYSYDSLGRLTQTNNPDGGNTSSCYTDAGGVTCTEAPPPYEVVVTTAITTSLNKKTTSVTDGVGRVIETQLNSDPKGTDYVDTIFDSMGRKASVSNPTRCYPTTMNCGESTWGATTYSYDSLGRVTSVLEPDASQALTSYAGNCTTVTDEAKNARTSCVDVLGRITGVWEDPGTSPHLNYETDYAYDALNNMLSATQKGGGSGNWRVRSFAYDGLSRLTSASNPESGTLTYSYKTSGGALCTGDASHPCTKTAPSPNQPATGTKTVTTTYTYDALNRVTGESYADGYQGNGATPGASYGYDGMALTGCTKTPPSLTDSYPLGQRTAMCDGSGAASWKHDKMGRVLQERRTIGSVVGDYETDVYNLDGSPASVTTLGYSVGYAYSGAGRALSATNGTTKFVSGATYAPPGELTAMTMGSTSSFLGIVTNNAYNDRLQPILLSAGVAGQNPVFSECFDFHLGVAVNTSPCSFSASTLGDNGNVYQVVNNRDNTRSQSFAYDSLNRINSGQSNGPQWGETFTIDAWSNLTNRAGISGKTYTEPLSVSVGTNNQLSGFGYDAAGNMTSNGSTSYVYDAENRLIATAGYSYIYDGDGQRVEKCTEGTTPGTCATGATGTLYWRGVGSDPLSETDLAGNVQNTYIFFNGQRIARRDSAGAVHYYFSDHLGSHGVVENATGTTCEQDVDYFPYGGQENDYCGSVAQNYKFTGKERDRESGNDYFGARYYGSTIGRFMSPDWSANQGPVPYADLGSPQTLNLYAYVQNNPLTLHDATGHYRCDPDTVTWGGNGVTVTAGACHFDLSDFPLLMAAVGHHYIPKQVWADISKASDAWKFLNRVTTGALKNPKLSNSFDRLHRSLNKDTEELVSDLEKQLGKSIEDFSRGDFQELAGRIERAGGDIEKFNARMEALEPEARTFGEAVAQALEEVFPAASNALIESAPLAGDVAEGAAEIE